MVLNIAPVGMTYNILSGGGLRRVAKEGWLRLEQRRIKAQLGRMRRQRGMRIVKDDEKSEDSDRWVN